MLTINPALFAILGVLFTGVGAAIAAAVTWGSFKNRQEQTERAVTRLEQKVDFIDTRVDGLNDKVVAMAAKSDVADRTGGHRPLVFNPKSG